jgi:hypothetical protein
MVTSEWSARRPVRISASAFRSRVHKGYLRSLAIGSLAAFLSACSALGYVPQAPRAGSVAELLRFGNRVQTLEDEGIEREYQRLRAQHEASPSSNTAIRMSLVLSRPGAPPDALAEALVLLTDTRTEPGAYADFSAILYGQINERYLATTESTSLSGRLGVEPRTAILLDAELAQIRATLKTAERQRIALGQQLDALKAIEERISRDAGVNN